jgi:hypothetical protein
MSQSSTEGYYSDGSLPPSSTFKFPGLDEDEDADALNNARNRAAIGLPKKRVRTLAQQQFIEALSDNPKNYLSIIPDNISPAKETNLRNINVSPNNPLHLSPGSANVLLGKWNQQLTGKLQKSKMDSDLNLLKKKMKKKKQAAAKKWWNQRASEKEKQQVLDEFHRVPFHGDEGEWFGIHGFVRKKYEEKKRAERNQLGKDIRGKDYLATVKRIEDGDVVAMETPPKSNTAQKSRKRKSKKRKRKTNKARGKGNKITKKQTKNKCPTRQKRKTSWIVQNSRRYINAFKRTKIPAEIFNFNKIIQVMEEAMLDGGYWIVQWKFNRSPGKYGHYFLSFDDEYPLDVKAKNKNIYTANIGGYKKSKTRKRNRKRRSRKTRK